MIEYAPEKKMGIGWLFFLPILIPLGIGAFYLYAYFVVHMKYSVPVPGNVRAFDPIGSYGEVEKFAGEGLRFKSLEADNVSSDGTMDFGASYDSPPHLTYTFLKSIPTPKDAGPVGAGGSPTGKWMRTVEVNLGKVGRYGEVSYESSHSMDTDFNSRGMDLDEGYPQSDPGEAAIPVPACSFADMWKVAIQKGAPASAVADITYDNYGYEFDLSESDIELYFTNNCKLTEDRYGIEPIDHVK
ncbi:MAG: hypothetical protein ABIO72_01400 [Patescibacteria group bacterium]